MPLVPNQRTEIMTDQPDRIRIWNEDTSRMIAPSTIEEIVCKLAPICREPESDPFGHLVFMRNTGINDETGKEIFADDIIAHGSEQHVYRVMYRRGGWWAMSLCHDAVPARKLNNMFRLLVVGNVFEDKELVRKGDIDEGRRP